MNHHTLRALVCTLLPAALLPAALLSSGLLSAGLLAPTLPAQGGQPRLAVEARFEPAAARPGEKVTLVLSAAIDPGYHVYGAKETTGIVPSLTVDKANTAPLALQGKLLVPDGRLHLDPDLPDFPGYWIEGEAKFKQAFVVAKDAKPGVVEWKGGLRYMACTEEMCDPEYTEALSAKLTVSEGAPRKPALRKPAPREPGPQGKHPPAKQSPASQLPALHTGNHQSMQLALVPPTARPGEVVKVLVRVAMEAGWHNYGAAQDPSLGEPATMKVTNEELQLHGSAVVPKGDPHESAGDTYYFLEGEWKMYQLVAVPKDAKPGSLQVAVDLAYMACNDAMCEDPVQARVGAMLEIEAGAPRAEYRAADTAGTGTGGSDTAGTGTQDGASPRAASDSGPGKRAGTGGRQASDSVIEGQDLNEMSLLLYLIGAVGAGLFALVMPCTYPMIPLTVSFFTKQSEKARGRPVFLALVYGGGIVCSYLVLGGLLGPVMQDIAANPWLNLVFGLAFVFFALSLFGMVELRPPQFLMRQSTKAQQLAVGSESPFAAVGGVFLMGVTLCVTSFACTAPFLGSMLAAGLNSGGQGRLLLGMGVFGLTMALPFVVLSLVPGKLPKSGAWMNTAKILFGFVELAAALKFFSNSEYSWNWMILPREVFLTIWAALFAIAGTYLLGLIKLKDETGGIGPGRLVSGTVVTTLAAYFALGASGYYLDNVVMNAFEPAYGAGDHAFAVSDGRAAVKTHAIVTDDFDGAIAQARAADKLLLVNFTGLT